METVNETEVIAALATSLVNYTSNQENKTLDPSQAAEKIMMAMRDNYGISFVKDKK